jgi:hypothetical protein
MTALYKSPFSSPANGDFPASLLSGKKFGVLPAILREIQEDNGLAIPTDRLSEHKRLGSLHAEGV